MVVKSPASSTQIPLALCLAVVLACVGLGAGFVWWYVRGPGQSRTVTLSAADLATLQNAGRPPMNPRNGPGRRPGLNRPPPDPDGVFPSGFWHFIRAGRVMVMVRTQLFAAPGVRPVLVFRQRNFGMLVEPPNFTIARRVVHEEALAHQLAVTGEQLAQLTAICAEPALKQIYVSRLPVTPADQDQAGGAWLNYQSALARGDRRAIAVAEAQLLQTVKSIGAVAMARAAKEYADADKTITDVLTQRQIDAYWSGKSLAGN